MKAYLSGAMEYEPDEGKSWRAEIELWLDQELGHTVFNPVSETEKLVGQTAASDYRKWKQTNIERYRNFIRQFVDQDIDAVINKCDYLICQWNEAARRGGGTHGEMTMAHYHGKPVYMVCEIPLENVSGWILACASQIFTSMEDLKTHIFKKYQK